MAATASSLPQPITGLVAALIVLGVVIFVAPPSARIWIAALAVTIAIFARGRNAAAVINRLRVTIYGG